MIGDFMEIIYGGSFNPPTQAHYEIAKYIIANFPNDEFFFLPTNNFYEKDNLKDFQYRVDMLTLVCKRLGPKAKISTFELELDQYLGTDYTLRHFHNPCFAMGADNLLAIEKWINYPNVIIDHKFIIFPRNNINLEKLFTDNKILKKYKNNFMIFDKFEELYESSTEYRNTKNSKILLPEVACYIEKNNITKEQYQYECIMYAFFHEVVEE
jgi:nicotinate-nucleotide adenylyltransferase